MAKTKVPYKKNYTKNPDNPYLQFPINLPKEMAEYLRELGLEKQLPVSRLIAYALENERDGAVNPFTCFCPIPETVYIPNAFAEEAGRILRLLDKFPRGVTLENLIIFKRSIGILKKLNFLSGYRELLESDKIEVRTKKYSGFGFEHNPEELFIFVKNPPPRMSRKGMKVLENKDEEIIRLKRELARAKAGIKA